MKNKKNRNVVTAVLIFTIIFMSIGYAFLSEKLTISGSSNTKGEWNIEMETVTAKPNNTNAESKSIVIDSIDKTKVDISLTVLQPGDYIEYDVVVKNNGNISATLSDILITQSTHENNIKLSHNATKGKVINSMESYSFVLKIEFPLTSTTIVTKETIDCSVDLDFRQS